MRIRSRVSAAALLAAPTQTFAVTTGCTNEIMGPPAADTGGTPPSTSGTGGTNPGAAGGPATSGTGGSAPAESDLPCDVQSLLAARCVVCHDADPATLLVTRADLVAPSTTDPGRTVAQEALLRMRSPASDHMPPPPMASAESAEIAAFEAWIVSGAPSSACGSSTPVGPDPYDTPVVCTSARYWTGGNEESPSMRPGGACITCHTREDEGPRFVVAGTLYPTPHEPNDCNGVAAGTGAVVVVTDATGVEHSLTPNSAGNFFYEGVAFPFPYTAKVSYGGRERVMVEAQDDGDCNSCHTEAGASRAPGRVFLP